MPEIVVLVIAGWEFHRNGNWFRKSSTKTNTYFFAWFD
jgi:hypothetical protein